MGTPSWAIPPLQALLESNVEVPLVVTQPDKLAGRKKNLTTSPVKDFALAHELPVFTPQSAKVPEFLARLTECELDAIFVCAYGQILTQATLDVAKFGCFNLHFSFLPRWRGASPVQAAIKHGDSITGVSLQKMVFQLDAGPILATSAPETIRPDDTYDSLGQRLSVMAGSLTKEALPMLSHSMELLEQNSKDATYCKVIKKEEGRVQWQKQTAVEIERMSRAFHPWPGIYSIGDDGKRLQFTSIQVLERSLPPGMIQEDFGIGTKEGSIKVERLKPEGKKEMDASAFLRGHPQFINTYLE